MPPETSNPQPGVNGGNGGRILRGTTNAVGILAYITGAIYEYRALRDAETNGYYMNYQGQIVITDYPVPRNTFPKATIFKLVGTSGDLKEIHGFRYITVVAN